MDRFGLGTARGPHRQRVDRFGSRACWGRRPPGAGGRHPPPGRTAPSRGSVLGLDLDTPAAGVSATASASRARTWARALDIDLRFTVAGAHWHGLGAGHGHLRGGRSPSSSSVAAGAAWPRWAELWLLDPEGRFRLLVEPTAPVITHPRARPVEPAPTSAVVPAAAGGDVGLEVAARDAAFAGADIDELVQARRARLRQLARSR